MIEITEKTFFKNMCDKNFTVDTITVDRQFWSYDVLYNTNTRNGYVYYYEYYNGYCRYYRFKNFDEFYNEIIFKREIYARD